MGINKTNIKDMDRNFAKFDLALICEECYKDLTDSERIIYTILKNQEGLSIKSVQNGNMRYVDSKGYVFVEISQTKLAKIVRKSEVTLRKAFKTLEKFNLIERSSMGFHNCDRIYVGNPISTITLGDYFKKISCEIEESKVKAEYNVKIKATNIQNINKKATTVQPVEAEEVKLNSSNKSICDSTTDYTPVPNKNIQENNNNEPMSLVKEARINIKKADMNEVNEKCTNIEALKIAINNIKGKSHGINALMSAYNEALNGNSNNNKGNEWGKGLKGGLGSCDMKIGDKSIKDVPSNDLNRMVEKVNQPYLWE